MKNSSVKKLIFCSLFLVIIVSTVAVLSCYAENYPDISRVDSVLYLNGNQQFFHRPGNGYVLISTDSTSKTMAALLDSNGELDYSCARKAIVIKFAYEKATLCGDFLYITGRSPNIANCVEIERLNLSSGAFIKNKIMNVNCDFSRDFGADTDGKLTLVTVPVGSVIEPGTQASLYIFNSDCNDARIDAQPVPAVSSSGEISSTDSSTSSDVLSSTTSSSASSQPSEESEPSLTAFRFDGPVTVESLQKVLDTNALGQKLRVFSSDNIEVKSGCIGTGQIIETILNGKTQSRYTAIIPGDLDGTGTVTEADCQILYSYFTKASSYNSSVLSGPFFDAAKINEDKKIDAVRKDIHASDILKIKRLIK